MYFILPKRVAPYLKKSSSLLCSMRLSCIFLLVVHKSWIRNMRVTATTAVSALQTVLLVPPNHEHRWDWLHRTGLLRIFRYLAMNFWSYVASGRTWDGADRFSRNVCHQLQTYAVCIPEERRLKCLTPIRTPRVKNKNILVKDRWVSAGWYTWQSIWTSSIHLIHCPPAVQWQTCAAPIASCSIRNFCIPSAVC